MTRIAVIGGGRIGEALIAGLLESGHAVRDLVVAEKFEARAAELASTYGILTTTISEASENADVIVLAVKPGDAEAVVTEIAKTDLDGEREQLIVSLIAGVPTVKFEPKLPAGFPVIRVMPNTPMLVGEGVSVLAPGRYAKAEHLELVRGILSSVGKVVTVKENQLDAVTAVSGSGPAYFFLVAEAMIDAGVGLGLTRDVASALVVQTMVGSAAMLDRSDETPTELRYAVTSPGGTTAAAVRKLEQGGLRAAFFDALGAANDRATEMGITPE
ncbi:pyrroline-5-carboxylate reductase [Rhodococcus sp. BP-252]|uniref:Pyrroline-5-carboxylate reductase n=1 Tax=Rhodococcoides kyotonense TaxID=398843 RepID=A0A177YCS8_9NOCA|nr:MULTISPECIES: pyrroline-5-carboxylate reductase [Rhodococcus]MBY6413646.1 pyrroline-5-carboxylate reductase [Rhodococcus sp. BP-320]MBY6418367.1 pyrroline-5-carboxylate reductase [Rhodococcus sp. BP-321]MBY6422492.1 pyrroline-5-carboxylate reductase [Rhodococcus sp. BP-324]MBY6428312.1 pyrroline-5-carboxylate reductase [Rhodococcus sp. BP-323]MBY6433489.1 pyrroline-5-carboxylate reductase [Rhodococcus sp. BP-322]